MPSTSKKTGAAKAASKSAKKASKPKSKPKTGGAKASVGRASVSKAAASKAKKPAAPKKASAKKASAPKAAAKKAGAPPKAAAKKAAAPKKATKVSAAKAASPKAASPKSGKKAAAPAAAKRSRGKSAEAVVAPAEAPKAAKALPVGSRGGPPGTRATRIAPRLTVRTPAGADELKQKLSALATLIGQVRGLKRTISRSFLEAGALLITIRDERLFEVKGYGSFEAFLEREVELGKQVSIRCVRAVEIFQPDAALAAGFERVGAAIAILDGDVDPSAAPPATSGTSSGSQRSPIPFHKF